MVADHTFSSISLRAVFLSERLAESCPRKISPRILPTLDQSPPAHKSPCVHFGVALDVLDWDWVPQANRLDELDQCLHLVFAERLNAVSIVHEFNPNRAFIVVES